MSDLSDRLHALLRCQAPEPRRPLETAETVGRRWARQRERGDPRRPRRELVRRDELYQVLEWYHEHAIRRNRWHRRLWRALRRLPVGRLDPFAWIRLRRENANTGGGHGPEALQ